MDKKEIIQQFFRNRQGVLASMHEKERVIAPLLERDLGIKLIVPENFDTDRFGTFTGDVERKGSQLEAAKQKAEAALKLTGETLAFSSEGVFGPHPFVPFLPLNREVVMMVDKKNGIELYGEAVSTETNFQQKEIENLQQAVEFCEVIGFGKHAVVLKREQLIKDEQEIIKGITSFEQLEEEVTQMLEQSPDQKVTIETDMRAFCNPTRMKQIELATVNLIEKLYNFCPTCFFPGLQLRERQKGLPCSWCGLPTDLIRADIYHCQSCNETVEKLFPTGKKQADPGNCPYCNP